MGNNKPLKHSNCFCNVLLSFSSLKLFIIELLHNCAFVCSPLVDGSDVVCVDSSVEPTVDVDAGSLVEAGADVEVSAAVVVCVLEVVVSAAIVKTGNDFIAWEHG